MKLKKKTIKTKTKRKRKRKSLYFGKEAHAAIIEYQNAKCKDERNKIYVDKIKHSFEKLSENLIFIHGFSSNKEHFNILKTDCVSFLYETLEKFDRDRGSKAFSYFNVCAKNFLIIRSKKNLKNRRRNVSIEDFKSLSMVEKNTIENYKVIPPQDQVMIIEEDKKLLRSVMLKIQSKVNNENEKLCIDAIITLFDKLDTLDFLNKRAIFVYLREISGLNPKQLSVAISNIRKYYREIVKNDDMYLFF